MGIRAGLASKTIRKGKVRATITTEEKGTTELEAEAFDYPHKTPASRAGCGVSTRRSENYQSAELAVWVEVPCTPGTEVAAGDYCVDKASVILQKYEDDLTSLVASLS